MFNTRRDLEFLLDIQDAIEIRLHPVPEALWKSLSRGQFASRELYRLRLQAEHALLVSGFDELVCLDLLKFTPFDYQVRAAQIALRHFRGRGMLCDEVGLGVGCPSRRLTPPPPPAPRADPRPRLVQIPYDLVIVDEAHHLKNRASASWTFVNDLQRKFILLLTAPPGENDLDELYNLITLLKPGQLSTPREFRKQFVARGDPRQPKNRGQLRELLGDGS